MLKFKSWHVFLFRRGWSSKAGVWNSRHLEANYWKGLMSHRGMQPRLVNPPILTTRQLYLVFCDMFSGGCAGGYVMCTFVANQPHSCRTTQVFDWLHIRKILHWSLSACMCMDGEAVTTGWLFGFTAWIKQVASERESTHCFIHREMVASQKMSP